MFTPKGSKLAIQLVILAVVLAVTVESSHGAGNDGVQPALPVVIDKSLVFVLKRDGLQPGFKPSAPNDLTLIMAISTRHTFPVNRQTFLKYAKGVAGKVDDTQAEYLLDAAIKDPTTVAEVLQLFNQGYAVITEANAAMLRQANEVLRIDAQLSAACDCVSGKRECAELRGRQLEQVRAINVAIQTGLAEQWTEAERLAEEGKRRAANVKELQHHHDTLRKSNLRSSKILGEALVSNQFGEEAADEHTVAKSEYDELSVKKSKLEATNRQLQRAIGQMEGNGVASNVGYPELNAEMGELEQQIRVQEEAHATLSAEKVRLLAALSTAHTKANGHRLERSRLSEQVDRALAELQQQQSIVDGLVQETNELRQSAVTVNVELSTTLGQLRAEAAVSRMGDSGTAASNAIRDRIDRLGSRIQSVLEQKDQEVAAYEARLQRLKNTHIIMFAEIDFDFVVDADVSAKVYSTTRFRLSVLNDGDTVQLRELECYHNFSHIDIGKGVILRVHEYDVTSKAVASTDYPMQQALNHLGHSARGKLALQDGHTLALRTAEYRLDVIFNIDGGYTLPTWDGFELVHRPMVSYSTESITYIGIQNGREDDNREPTNTDCTPIWNANGSIIEAIKVEVIPWPVPLGAPRARAVGLRRSAAIL